MPTQPSEPFVETQQAAEILGLSRPTVMSLIEKGKLAATVPGSRRSRLLLADVMNFREALSTRRDRFIEQSSADYDFASEIEETSFAEILTRARTSAQR